MGVAKFSFCVSVKIIRYWFVNAYKLKSNFFTVWVQLYNADIFDDNGDILMIGDIRIIWDGNNIDKYTIAL